jgi:hypothetical protein
VGAIKPIFRGVCDLLPGADSKKTLAEVLADPGFGNQNLGCVVYRQDLSQVETSRGVYDWSSIDAVVAKAKSIGKKVSITVIPGFNTPAWVYAAGVKPLKLEKGTIPLPWDATWLTIWQEFVAAFGSRYDGDTALSYLQMEGCSTQGECYLCHTTADVQALVAVTGTTSQGLTDWNGAMDQVTEMYVKAFPSTPLLWAGGAQLPGDDSAFQAVAGYVMHIYPGHVGVKSNGLDTGSHGYVESVGAQMRSTNPIGYQTTHAFNDPSKLQGALNNAIQHGADFIEVITTDAALPSDQPEIVTANQALQK